MGRGADSVEGLLYGQGTAPRHKSERPPSYKMVEVEVDRAKLEGADIGKLLAALRTISLTSFSADLTPAIGWMEGLKRAAAEDQQVIEIEASAGALEAWTTELQEAVEEGRPEDQRTAAKEIAKLFDVFAAAAKARS